MKKIYLLLISMLLISMNLKSFDNKSRAGLGMTVSWMASYYLIANAIKSYKTFKRFDVANDKYDFKNPEFRKACEYALLLLPAILMGVVSFKSSLNLYLKSKPSKLDGILSTAGKLSSFGVLVAMFDKAIYKLFCDSKYVINFTEARLATIAASLLGLISEDLVNEKVLKL